MPTYLYFCSHCQKEFEEFHSISFVLENCPKCEAEGQEVKLQKLINYASGGIVKLTGQELADKIKSDATQIQKDAANNEKKYANLLGENKYEQLQTQLDRRGR